MKNKKIHAVFLKNGNEVAFTVYHMDERFRSDGEIFNRFKASNGVIIKSLHVPDFTIFSDENKILFLRGTDKSADNRIAIGTFSSEASAEAFIALAYEALAEWSEKWEGWQETEPTVDEKEICRHVIF